jgi:hypothetical protein
LQLRSHLEADQSVESFEHKVSDTGRTLDADLFGVWKPGDTWQGDVCLRTLHDLLLKIDRQGCEMRILAISINCSTYCFYTILNPQMNGAASKSSSTKPSFWHAEESCTNGCANV